MPGYPSDLFCLQLLEDDRLSRFRWGMPTIDWPPEIMIMSIDMMVIAYITRCCCC